MRRDILERIGDWYARRVRMRGEIMRSISSDDLAEGVRYFYAEFLPYMEQMYRRPPLAQGRSAAEFEQVRAFVDAAGSGTDEEIERAFHSYFRSHEGYSDWSEAYLRALRSELEQRVPPGELRKAALFHIDNSLGMGRDFHRAVLGDL